MVCLCVRKHGGNFGRVPEALYIISYGPAIDESLAHGRINKAKVLLFNPAQPQDKGNAGQTDVEQAQLAIALLNKKVMSENVHCYRRQPVNSVVSCASGLTTALWEIRIPQSL